MKQALRLLSSNPVVVLGVRRQRFSSVLDRTSRGFLCTTTFVQPRRPFAVAVDQTPTLRRPPQPPPPPPHTEPPIIPPTAEARKDVYHFELRMKQKIYCEGSLLHAVQTSHIFADCKTFVDMPLKHDAESTLNKWEALQSLGAVNAETLAAFIRENFDEPEGELVECAPADWDPMTDKFRKIGDEDYRRFATALHGKWPTLYRKIAEKVLVNPERYSIIPVPNPFIVPGGRFREMYYWDSFFTIKGLIASGMLQTVRGMIDNMQFLVETFGFIPNGNRVYYLNRSQPPLLTWCAHAYFEATKDVSFVENILPTLRKELAFFQTNRSIMLEGWSSPLFRFTVQAVRPRPESYREDMECAHHLTDLDEKCTLWGDIAAAAESGRDFSARWFANSGPLAGKLQSMRTSQLVPVELNAIICGNIRLMGEMYDVINDVEGSKWCALMQDQMRRTMHQVLWNEEHGCWFDYDLKAMEQITTFNDTNFFPMFTRSTHEGFDSNRVADYLIRSGALGFPGGFPSSLVTSGEQWDFPNSWAPTTWVLIEGLRAAGQPEMARDIADKWVRKNFNMWKSSGGKMFEKYNVVSPCYKVSGGGEYEMQEGFGWTNGVILDLLTTYGHLIRWTAGDTCECCSTDGFCGIDVATATAAKVPDVVDELPSSRHDLHFEDATLPQTPSTSSLESMDTSTTSSDPEDGLRIR
ncbi:unnamed protein product [Caenorhabditis auriculariae]|uniref:Trehalase n=1 Tax=Caenorhabditis auriculariae TaxID=2777116 RepID=A0A8S1HSZ5_9PELO|nr:unnamed protein product [Caenorhabditis auriculariae]